MQDTGGLLSIKTPHICVNSCDECKKKMEFDILKHGQTNDNPIVKPNHEMEFGFHWTCQTNGKAHTK